MKRGMGFCCPNLTCAIVGCSDHIWRFAIFGMSNTTPCKYQKNDSGLRPSQPMQKCCLLESCISTSLRDPTIAMQSAPMDLGRE